MGNSGQEGRVIDGAEVAKHSKKGSCWIVLDSNVYDVTSFLGSHPGGAAILLKQGGGDATSEFEKYHPLSYIQDLPPNSLLGPIDPNTLGALRSPTSETSNPPSDSPSSSSSNLPHLSLCVSTPDFEKAARAVLPKKSYIYASTSANTGLSLRANLDDWGRITFRPRILRDVGGDIDMSRSILGHKAAYPFYISPMGTMGALHEGAEPEMVRGGTRKGCHLVISTASSKTSGQIWGSYDEELARLRGMKKETLTQLFFQYYMPVDREKAIELLKTVKELGYKGLWITVDTNVLGKRTLDRVLQAEEALALGLTDDDEEDPTSPSPSTEEPESTAQWEAGSENPVAPAMGGRPVSGQLSPHVNWSDLTWIREHWDGPIVLKGVQCVEDAKMALQHRLDGILLSNHGGRQLHTAPSALMTLCELRCYLPEIFSKMEVYVDGGLRDGSDVLKALCLGATAVGVGRPFLYALAAYGAKGVERCVDVLADELDIGMRLLGVRKLEDLRPDMVNAQRLLNEMWRPDAWEVRSKL